MTLTTRQFLILTIIRSAKRFMMPAEVIAADTGLAGTPVGMDGMQRELQVLEARGLLRKPSVAENHMRGWTLTDAGEKAYDAELYRPMRVAATTGFGRM